MGKIRRPSRLGEGTHCSAGRVEGDLKREAEGAWQAAMAEQGRRTRLSAALAPVTAQRPQCSKGESMLGR